MCTVTDQSGPQPLGSTLWSGTAFHCPGFSDQISLPHSQFNTLVTSTCGSLRATAVGVNGTSYMSQLMFTATSELNGTTVTCSPSGMAARISQDVILVGGGYYNIVLIFGIL